MRGIRCIAVLAVFLLLPALAGAYDLESRVAERTLANGLKVIVLPRHRSPVVSLRVTCVVGAVDEPAGRSGMAHLVEHMLFKGTRRLGTTDYAAESRVLDRIDEVAGRLDALRRAADRTGGDDAAPEMARLEAELKSLQEEAARYVVKDEIDSIYSRNGGENSNAFTSTDMTVYLVDLPANRLPLWAAIEADRMRNPVFREFYSERDVVMEERRQSYDSQPDRLLWELFQASAFLAHPYGRPTIGWPGDVAYIPRADAEEFFRRFYAPDNAVVTIVGDVDPEEAFRVVEEHFGSIPPSGRLDRPITPEPEQRGERRVYLEADASPSLRIGYHKPTLPHRDDYVLDVVDGLLSEGRTSRLHRRLVEKERAVASVGTANGYPGARYDSLFSINADPLEGRTPEEVEALVYEELERLKTEPVPADELDKVRRGMKADFVRRLQSNGGLALTLGYFQAVAGDWRYLTRYEKVLDSITADEIMDTARRIFTPENRTVAILRKKP